MSTQPTSQPSLTDAALRLYPNIALLGKAGAGKDKAAELLRTLYPVYQRVAFADQLKNVAAMIWGEQARTHRQYLQQLGVAVRAIDPDAWVNAAFEHCSHHPIVITDVRFPNEVRECLARGCITVKVEADRATRLNRLRDNGKLEDESQLDHESETALDGYTPDYVIINMGTEVEMANRLITIVEHERSYRG